MSKAKLLKQETKPEGYVLTDKGLQAAPGRGKFPGSMSDVLLQVMAKSPGAPLTKGSLSEDLWQKASEVLARLETEGLVKKAGSDIELNKPKVVLGAAARAAKLQLQGLPGPKVQRLTKRVYSDRRGERLARKKRRGWTPVNY